MIIFMKDLREMKEILLAFTIVEVRAGSCFQQLI